METNQSTSSEDEMFVNDSDQDEENDPSFYRSFDNTDEYRRLKNQAKNPVEVVKEPEVEYYGKGDMPELFDAVICGLMFDRLNSANFKLQTAK